MVPVILTHRGGQEYVETVIRQAQKLNERVILLGDGENKHLEVEWYDHRDYWDGAKRFESLYRHMSNNRPGFELFCFQLYFLARDFARVHGLKRLFLMDSDVLLYKNVNEGPLDFAVSWCRDQGNMRWSACAHNSYWTLPILEGMCDFLMDAYGGGSLMDSLEKKWSWHQREDVPGGVCDMTLLYFYIQDKVVVNQSMVRDGATWDDNINQPENYLPDEYIMSRHGTKAIFLDDLHDFRPYGLRPANEKIWFNALHFQGQAKKLMRQYVVRGDHES